MLAVFINLIVPGRGMIKRKLRTGPKKNLIIVGTGKFLFLVFAGYLLIENFLI